MVICNKLNRSLTVAWYLGEGVGLVFFARIGLFGAFISLLAWVLQAYWFLHGHEILSYLELGLGVLILAMLMSWFGFIFDYASFGRVGIGYVSFARFSVEARFIRDFFLLSLGGFVDKLSLSIIKFTLHVDRWMFALFVHWTLPVSLSF
jgi:hypothetical protein